MKQSLHFPGFGWWLRFFGWCFMLGLIVLLVLMVSPYLTLNFERTNPPQRPVYQANLFWLLLHIVGSMVAAILGPFQFLPQLRRHWLNLHRWLGRIYLLGVLAGGIGGLYMAFFAYGGWVARAGFLTLAILWLYSAYKAYDHIRRREIEAHRHWMIRNYALVFGAVTLRLGLLVSQVANFDFLTTYVIMAWMAWVPNLVVVELWMRWSSRARKVAG
jgi:uncharacterized membrane protein